MQGPELELHAYPCFKGKLEPYPGVSQTKTCAHVKLEVVSRLSHLSESALILDHFANALTGYYPLYVSL
jgi:hypothetical protein